MKRSETGPRAVFTYVCVLVVLMCTFFVGEAFAADTLTGTTAKKEETVQLELAKGTSLITVSDNDSWVYAQLQETGANAIGTAVGGEKLLTDFGQKKTFAVPVKKAGTYYLYLHGTNAGAKYSVKQIKAGGTLKSGKPVLATSFGDNESVVWYKMKVEKSGQLRVTVNDSSVRYAGYSKVRLKKDGVDVSPEEHLIRGLGFSTVYGVSKGTYKIGVRSSSEVYKIKADFVKMTPGDFGSSKKKAAVIERKKTCYGVIEPGDAGSRWYRIDLPEKTEKVTRRTITIKADNSNVNTAGGLDVYLKYKKKSDGEYSNDEKSLLINNYTESLEFKLFKDKVRTVYIRVTPVEGASGTYEISWK